MLSHLAIARHHATPAALPSTSFVQSPGSTPSLPGNPHIHQLNQPGPIKNEIGHGFAVKIPRFYTYYGGPLGFPTATSTPKGSTTTPPAGNPLNGYLNAAGATARIVGSDLQLTGIIAGTVVTNPGPGQEAFYNFGINRGGAVAPGPFLNKPRITFDSVVTIGVTQNGIGAVVTTLDPTTLRATSSTTLDPASVTTNFDAVKVTVPLSLLPSTGADPSQYRVNFFPSDAAPPPTFNDIASFLPEGSTFQVAVARTPSFFLGGRHQNV